MTVLTPRQSPMVSAPRGSRSSSNLSHDGHGCMSLNVCGSSCTLVSVSVCQFHPEVKKSEQKRKRRRDLKRSFTCLRAKRHIADERARHILGLGFQLLQSQQRRESFGEGVFRGRPIEGEARCSLRRETPEGWRGTGHNRRMQNGPNDACNSLCLLHPPRRRWLGHVERPQAADPIREANGGAHQQHEGHTRKVWHTAAVNRKEDGQSQHERPQECLHSWRCRHSRSSPLEVHWHPSWRSDFLKHVTSTKCSTSVTTRKNIRTI